MLEEGNNFFRRNLLEEASETYREALDRLKKWNENVYGDQVYTWKHLHLSLLLNVSRSERRRGHYEESVDFATEAIEMDPESTETLITRAKAFKVGNMISEALEDYTTALRIDPTNKAIYLEFLKLREKLKLTLRSRKNAFFSQSCDSIAYIDDSVTNCSSI